VLSAVAEPICPQVALLALVEPASKADYAKVAQRRLDFLLCIRDTFSPLLVIELDGSSHQHPDRQARDADVDAALYQSHGETCRLAAGWHVGSPLALL